MASSTEDGHYGPLRLIGGAGFLKEAAFERTVDAGFEAVSLRSQGGEKCCFLGVVETNHNARIDKNDAERNATERFEHILIYQIFQLFISLLTKQCNDFHQRRPASTSPSPFRKPFLCLGPAQDICSLSTS